MLSDELKLIVDIYLKQTTAFKTGYSIAQCCGASMGIFKGPAGVAVSFNKKPIDEIFTENKWEIEAPADACPITNESFKFDGMYLNIRYQDRKDITVQKPCSYTPYASLYSEYPANVKTLYSGSISNLLHATELRNFNDYYAKPIKVTPEIQEDVKAYLKEKWKDTYFIAIVKHTAEEQQYYKPVIDFYKPNTIFESGWFVNRNVSTTKNYLQLLFLKY